MDGCFLMVKYGFHVGKYTSPMDPMGLFQFPGKFQGKRVQREKTVDPVDDSLLSPKLYRSSELLTGNSKPIGSMGMVDFYGKYRYSKY